LFLSSLPILSHFSHEPASLRIALRAAPSTAEGLTDGARNVIGCHLTQATRVLNALVDVASNICQSFVEGGVTEGGAGGGTGVEGIEGSVVMRCVDGNVAKRGIDGSAAEGVAVIHDG